MKRSALTRYAVALSAAAIAAPAADAAIVNLTPNIAGFSFPYLGTGGTLQTGGSLFGTAQGPQFGARNAIYFSSTTTPTYSPATTLRQLFASGSLIGIGFPIYTPGVPITTGGAFYGGLQAPVSFSGTFYMPFLTAANQVGWFLIQWGPGGPGGPFVFLGAAFDDTPGGSIQTGQIPEPSSSVLAALGMLALGARGLRRVRKERDEEQAA